MRRVKGWPLPPWSARRATRSLVVLATVATSMLLTSPHAGATLGVNDYPRRLKIAAQNSLVDPWLFYNRECTSFVAWRLNNDAHVPFNDYYLDEHWGNASNWKSAAVAAGITVNDRPSAGAVAWWRAGSAGSSRGHVAWVYSVSGGEITVEEYNYLVTGGYDTRTISSDSSVWPSAFIHIRDVKLRNTTPPTVSGTPRVGARVTADHGGWRPRGAEFTYQWMADGAPIDGAVGRAFTPGPALLGSTLRVEVTAAEDGLGSKTVVSAKSDPVLRGIFSNSQPPLIAGAAQVGQSLTASTGEWSPTGTYSYRWYADGRRISGADAASFRPRAAQLNKAITVRVTASRTAYRKASVVSSATALVSPGVFTNTSPPSVDGVAQVGSTLTALPGDWSPSGATSYQWLADGRAIPDATGATYRPTADDVGRAIAIEVTVQRRGYSVATATSAATAPVIKGLLTNIREPEINGKPQVGVRLTADAGDWSPKATFSYQWYADGVALAGATNRAYTPTAAQVGKAITLEVTARRPGYRTAVVGTAPTAPVAPGHISNRTLPGIVGVPMLGGSVRATIGSWSLTPTSVAYQWRLDGSPIAGATKRTYAPTAPDGTHRLSVRVTVSAPGYDPAHATSAAKRVLLGTASLDHPPRIRGRAIAGATLRARIGAISPSDAQVTYQWYRGSHRIRLATHRTYDLRGRDVGHRMSVRVTVSAPYWATATFRSERTARVGPALS